MTFGEEHVGIELFYTDTKEVKDEGLVALNCAFKHRFNDFIVNEIDTEGEVVWFKPETDLQKWKPSALAAESEAQAAAAE